MACESEDKLLRAQVSAQEQVTQLQSSNHEAQAYWDHQSQIMLIVARASNESPSGAKERIAEILQRLNKKHPSSLRKLASNSENLHQLQKALLRRFRADLLNKTLLEEYHQALGDKLKKYYAQESEHFEKKEVSVQPGQTLVKISREYYRNPRRWTELYLVNQDRISNWDVLEVGMALDIYLPKKVFEQSDTGDHDQKNAY